MAHQDVKRFHDMLLFALWVRRHGTRIFEVELPGAERLGALDGHMVTSLLLGNAPMRVQDFPDGARRARQTQPRF